jgi:hypothetical protein
MRITTIHSPPSGTRLLDLDLRDGVLAALVEREGVQHLAIGDWNVKPPRIVRFPIVRLVDKTTAVVVDTRTTGIVNAWLVRTGTGVITAFLAGDAISDVVLVAGVLAVAYFDEGVYGHVAYGSEGIAIFSSDGAFLWGYHSTMREGGPVIDDCYCACAGPDERLWFHPYSDFPLIALDVRTRTEEVFSLPDSLRGTKAISTNGADHWFFSPSNHESCLFRWAPHDLEPSLIGKFAGRLRGLTGGRFINVTPASGRLVDVAA